jgi:hypothetical protein
VIRLPSLERSDWYLPVGPGAEYNYIDPFFGDINGESPTRMNNQGWTRLQPGSVLSMHLMATYTADLLARKGKAGMLTIEHALPSGQPWVVPIMPVQEWMDHGWRDASVQLPIEASWPVQTMDPNGPNYYDINALVGMLWEGAAPPGDPGYAASVIQEMIDLSGGFLPYLLGVNVLDDLAFTASGRVNQTGIRKAGSVDYTPAAGAGDFSIYCGNSAYSVPVDFRSYAGVLTPFCNSISYMFWDSNSITRPSQQTDATHSTRIHVADPAAVADCYHSRASWPSLMELAIETGDETTVPLKQSDTLVPVLKWADPVGSEGFVDRYLNWGAPNLEGENPLNKLGYTDSQCIMWVDVHLWNQPSPHGGLPWIIPTVQHDEATRTGLVQKALNHLPVKREFRRDTPSGSLPVVTHLNITYNPISLDWGPSEGCSTEYDSNWTPVMKNTGNGFRMGSWTGEQCTSSVKLVPLEGYPINSGWHTYTTTRTDIATIVGVGANTGLHCSDGNFVLDTVANASKPRFSMRWMTEGNVTAHIMVSTPGLTGSDFNNAALNNKPALVPITFTGSTMFQDTGGHIQYYDWQALGTSGQRSTYSGAYQGDPNGTWSAMILSEEGELEFKLYEKGGAFNFDISPECGFIGGRVISELESRMSDGDPNYFAGATASGAQGIGYPFAVMDLPRGVLIFEVRRYDQET